MLKNCIFAALLLLLSAQASWSQEAWTLDRCIQYAVENNIQLKQQALGVKLSENNLLQSKLQTLPSVNGGLGQTFRFGRSVDPLTYEFTTENTQGSSFSASTRIDLFRGLQNWHSIKKNQFDLSKSLKDLEAARNDLILAITRYFLQVMFNEELLLVAQNRLDVSQQQVNQTSILVEAGSLPAGDLLEIQAQYATDELNLLNARNQLDLSLLDLAQLLDIKDPDNFNIDPPNFDSFELLPTPTKPDQLYATAIDWLPQVQSAQLAVQSAQMDLAIAQGSLSPSLGMSSSIGTGYSDQIMDFQTGNIMPFRDQIGFASTTSLNFSLSVPIFNGYSARTAINNAKLGVKNNDYQLQLVQNQLRKEIQQAHADARASREQYTATEKTLRALEESFRYTQEKFNLGMLTSLDYNLAKSNLDKAQSDLLQAKYNYIFNRKILDFYLGLPIDLQ